jgi:hypothetical protein
MPVMAVVRARRHDDVHPLRIGQPLHGRAQLRLGLRQIIIA